MTIKTGSRLQQLRKENGYSQDALAEKLGLSRQAISKWERGESSPDTDNLIALAKLYGITLDELLSDGEKMPEKAVENNNENRSETPDDNLQQPKRKKRRAIKGDLGKKLFTFPMPIIVIIAYVLIGIIAKIWHPTWLIFLFIPIYYHYAGACCTKTKRSYMLALPIPEIIVFIYLMIGLFIGGKAWVTGTALFLFIPLYYWITAVSVKKTNRDYNDSSK